MFNAVQFHFHSPSEHTHNGKHYDLEMHIVHTAARTNDTSPIKYGAVGIFFDVEDFDSSMSVSDQQKVERFIGHLKFGATDNPVVPQVALGELMALVNYESRWVYHGSLTTPPCSPFIYWNVINKVYPIKQEQLDLFG